MVYILVLLNGFLPTGFWNKIMYLIHSILKHATRSIHPDLLTSITYSCSVKVQFMKLFMTQFSILFY